MIDNVKRHSDNYFNHNPDMGTLGQRLKTAREKLKLSQKELGKRIGVNQSVIASLETGSRKTSAYTVLLAEALKVDPLWLSEGKGHEIKLSNKDIFKEELQKFFGIPMAEMDMEFMLDLQAFAKQSIEDRKQAIHQIEQKKSSKSKRTRKGEEGKPD